MINVLAYINSIKTTWLRRILNQQGKWLDLLMTQIDNNLFLKCGEEYIKECIDKQNNKFWKDVFQACYSLFKKFSESIDDDNFVIKSPLWFNGKIRINRKHVFFKEWFQKGIIYVNDIVKENNVFYSFQEFREKFPGIRSNFLQYNGLISAVKKMFKNFPHQNIKKLVGPWISPQFIIYLKSKKGSKDMYGIFVKNKYIPIGKSKWNTIFGILEENQWKNIYKNNFSNIKNTKFQWFQYRINQNILATNKYLFKI